MKSVLLSGYYGFGNLGDELILKNIAALLRDSGFSSVYAVSGNIEYSKSKHQDIEFIERDDYQAIVNVVKGIDLVALGGGGLFQDYNRLETAGLFESPKMGVHSYINVPLIAHIYAKPIAYLFQGVGPLFSEDSRNFTKYAYSLSDYISVRDRDSVRLLEELGIQDVILSSDPYFLFPVERVETGKERPRVAISLRQWVDKGLEERVIRAISGFLNTLPLEYDPYFISFQDHDEGNTDSSVYRRIEADLKEGRVLNLIRSKDHSLDEIERLVSGFDFVIGMRLHSIILAIKYGIPFLAIPYWKKVESLLNETGLEDRSIPLNELSGERIREGFLSMVSESSDLKKKIEKGRSAVEKRLSLDIDHFRDFIKGIAEVKTFPFPVEKPDEITPLPPEWVSYKAYQEKLQRQFSSRRYSSFQIKRILNRRDYKKIIFYPSPILWDVPLFQRPHQIFKELSKRGYLIFFLSPDPQADRAEPIREINENLYLIKDIDMLYCLKDEPIVLWITWTPNIVCKELFPNGIVVYDWIDELDVFGYYSKFMEIDHRKLLRQADIVFATSHSLLEEAKTVRPETVLVPNGVAIEDFKVEGDILPGDMAEILAQGKPVIGFFGLLAEWRMDYDLVNHLCRECKDLNFLLIGPSYDGSSKRLRSSENLFLLGPRKYEDLKHYLRYFDVAIIPYKVDRITNSVFPVKLCEYMAGGKPVVTTNMRECRKFRSVLVSETYEDFIKNIRKALTLKGNEGYLEVLREETEGNTWKRRADEIVRAVESERVSEGTRKVWVEEELAIVREEAEAMQKLLNQALHEGINLNAKLHEKEGQIAELLSRHEEQERHYHREVSRRDQTIGALQDQLTRAIGERDQTIGALQDQLTRAIGERDQSINLLQSQLNQVINQKENIQAQQYNIIADRNNLWNQLTNIYASDFWKVARIYYQVRNHTPIVKHIFKGISILRREGLKGFGQKIRNKATPGLSPIPLSASPDGLKPVEPEKAIPPAKEERSININKYDVIFFSIINWDFRFQRPQQIATRFSRNGHRVFYLSVDLEKRDSYGKRQIAENIYEIILPFKENTAIYNADIREGLDLLSSSFKEIFGDFRIKESVSIVEYPLWHPLVERLKGEFGTKVLFDCMDEFTGFGNVGPDVIYAEERLLQLSDFCITTSVRLYEKFKNQCPRVSLVRNGTDFHHFHTLPPNNLLKGVKKPIIGYYGAIAEWFDTDTVEHIAKQKPDWSIVLIGHTFGSDVDRLKKHKNIHLLGEKPYGELPKFLYWFDVCIIPFTLNDLTFSTNPVKFYEFISSGKPVVSSPLPELSPYKDLLYLSPNKEEFLKNIETALKEDDGDLIKRRMEVARENDWDSRFEEIAPLLKPTFPLVSIILVTYNNLEFTSLCIQSIYEKTAYPNFELIVVDNGSSDGTVEWLKRLGEEKNNIKIILNGENLGFASANNIGLKKVQGEYIIFLNNDTVVTRGWIYGLLKYLQNPEIGMVGPVTNNIGNEARISADYKDLSEMERFAEEYTSRNRGVAFEISALAFYCSAIRKRVLEKIGMLDEEFSIGMFEDDDYALRLKNAGYKLVCAEDVFIHHFGGASFGKFQPEEYKRCFEENRKKYEQKWKIPWQPHKYRAGVA